MKIIGVSVLLASISVAEIVLVGSCTMRQAAKVCEAEGLSLARVDKRSITEVDMVMGSYGAERAWSAHSDPSVIIYSAGKGHRCSDHHVKLPCLCYGPDGKPEPEKEKSSHCKRGECKKPKPVKNVCKKVIKKEMKHGHDKCCKQEYYEHSFSDSESWTSTHVSQEIKTRVPKKCRRHVYKCHSSTSSCSDSPKPSESCESTSYTTEEVVRPHKRVYYHKQVEVKDRVCPKEIRQEVFKKKSRKPCEGKQCEKRRMKCHNGMCQLRSKSYSGSCSSGSSHRLQKRAFGEDEIDTKVKNIKEVKATKEAGKDRYRAPIKFPSSCFSSSSNSSESESDTEATKSSVSISTSSDKSKKIAKKPVKKPTKVEKKPAKSNHKAEQGKQQTESRKHGKHGKKGSKKCSKHECKSSERFVYKIKKGKACEAPYVKVPHKRTREVKIVSDIAKHKKDKPVEVERKAHKCSSGSTKTSSKSSPKPASRKHERKPAKKSDSSAKSKSKSGSSGKQRKVAQQKEKAPECPRMKCKNGRCELKRPEHHHRHRHHHHQRHHPKSSSSSSLSSSSSSSDHKRRHHRKHKHHRKPMGYKQKIAKRTAFTPISTSSTPHRTPVVLQKRHVRCN